MHIQKFNLIKRLLTNMIISKNFTFWLHFCKFANLQTIRKSTFFCSIFWPILLLQEKLCILGKFFSGILQGIRTEMMNFCILQMELLKKTTTNFTISEMKLVRESHDLVCISLVYFCCKNNYFLNRWHNTISLYNTTFIFQTNSWYFSKRVGYNRILLLNLPRFFCKIFISFQEVKHFLLIVHRQGKFLKDVEYVFVLFQHISDIYKIEK
eukprot:TRINITY_DN5014_c0_g1_i7.p1 TRINITY_DN5014_c0_g1~~TRINITY_DN5014_c0_g1_i7.p1  ORF type:complete len:210 (+),score=-13.98 TRINITY_DN5014_c0_g1_i7:45-674(+)